LKIFGTTHLLFELIDSFLSHLHFLLLFFFMASKCIQLNIFLLHLFLLLSILLFL